MANPFLVIGGVVVGIAASAAGVFAVPGWIDSANDSNVRSDLSQIAIGQEASYTVAANYTDLEGLEDGTVLDGLGNTVDSGVRVQTSAGVPITVASAGESWAAAGVSKSGHVFVRTSDSAETFTTDSKDFETAMGQINNNLAGWQLSGSASAPVLTFAG